MQATSRELFVATSVLSVLKQGTKLAILLNCMTEIKEVFKKANLLNSNWSAKLLFQKLLPLIVLLTSCIEMVQWLPWATSFCCPKSGLSTVLLTWVLVLMQRVCKQQIHNLDSVGKANKHYLFSMCFCLDGFSCKLRKKYNYFPIQHVDLKNKFIFSSWFMEHFSRRSARNSKCKWLFTVSTILPIHCSAYNKMIYLVALYSRSRSSS